MSTRLIKRAQSLFGHTQELPPICLLDTYMGSENAGDEIIMQAASAQIFEATGKSDVLHVPTHYWIEESEHLDNYLKILCGTNIIYKDMEGQQQWALPEHLKSYANTCLLGVGMSDIGLQNPPSAYSKRFFKEVLSKKLLHSVRDEGTLQFFKSIGITNVVNTSCPSTWSITPELCAEIPKTKARSVITTITDYNFDPEHDFMMLDFLQEAYEKVYLWLQGSHDLDWCLKSYPHLDGCILIEGKLEFFDTLLDLDSIDYVGTRLHAGIRAINHGVHSLVIAIDNRARAISHDIGLPVLERNDMAKLPSLIASGFVTEITPQQEIARWKSQFSSYLTR